MAPAKPSRRSVDEYDQAGREQALRFFNMLVARPGKALTSEELRDKISGLPASTLLQTTMADFWCRLTRDEGQWRRRDKPPENVFTTKQGASFCATKGAIEQWDADWRKRNVAEYEALEFGQGGTGLAKAEAARLQQDVRRRYGWVVDTHAGIVGMVDECPKHDAGQALQRIAMLRIVWWSIGEAVGHRWVSTAERVLWINRLAAAYRVYADLVERPE